LIFSIAAELPPPPDPFDPLADPETKKSIEIINMAEAIIDEVVTKLLNEAAEKSSEGTVVVIVKTFLGY
jgi:hypothetical protein